VNRTEEVDRAAAALEDGARVALPVIAACATAGARPGDIPVASLHWGSNWGHAMPRDHVRFAHRLIDAGVRVVHGHSSHHPRPIEFRGGGVILYGCGDFINDYEGISGHERYRDELRAMWLPSFDRSTGRLAELRLAVLRAERMRLRRAASEEVAWLADSLTRASSGFGVRLAVDDSGMLVATPTR
jgi:poly-gamma-glutamate synthesis protein (capsule biosynthesis protein)